MNQYQGNEKQELDHTLPVLNVNQVNVDKIINCFVTGTKSLTVKNRASFFNKVNFLVVSLNNVLF